MTAKWLDKGTGFRVLALTAALAGSAGAQLVDGQWRAAPQRPAARVAVQVNAPTVFAQQGANPIVYPRQPVQFTYVPTIVMSDGSVYANYGYGYQQVVTCGPAAVTPYAVYTTGAVYSSGTVSSTGAVSGVATLPQQVPNQHARSQQMVTQSTQLYGQVQSPCGAQVAPAPAPGVGRRY